MDETANFLHQILNSITTWFVGLDWSRIAVLGLVLALVVFFRKPLAQVVIRIVVYIGKRIGVTVSETVQSNIETAVQTLIVSVACFEIVERLGLPESIEGTTQKIVVSIAIAAVFASAYSLTDLLAQLLDPYRTSRTETQLDWVVRIAKGAAVVLGVSAVLKVWGIDLGPVITGMGLVGAGVALAAQDLLKNLLAGMTNISERRFQVGDWIRVENVVEGVVERVEFRSTLIRLFNSAPVHVPNADLANGRLTNFSRMPHRRIYWKVAVVYSSTIEQIERITTELETYITSSDDFIPPEKANCFVRVDSFAPSSIELLVYCFTQSAAYPDYMQIKERLVLNIKRIVEGAGSSFAYPSQSIYVEETLQEPGKPVPDPKTS